jgi:rRNA processing protein Krr1/Pno1
VERVKEESLTFQLAAKSHGAIFGEKGNTLAKIQQVTGTRVKMPEKGSKDETVSIRGSAEGIKLAQQAILDVASQGYSTLLNPNLVKVEINVPSKQQGGLIGEKGANIRSIQLRTDTKITIPSKESKSDIITVVGPPEGVKAAQAAIKSIIAQGFSDVTHPDHIKRSINIPREQTRFLIGPGGKTIKDIQTSSGVKVNIPEAESEEQKRDAYQVITITGPKPNVLAAERAILLCMQPVEDETPDPNSPWVGSAEYSEDAQWE